MAMDYTAKSKSLSTHKLAVKKWKKLKRGGVGFLGHSSRTGRKNCKEEGASLPKKVFVWGRALGKEKTASTKGGSQLDVTCPLRLQGSIKWPSDYRAVWGEKTKQRKSGDKKGSVKVSLH